jgi:hypothetical protein
MKKEFFPVLISLLILMTGLGVTKLFDLLKPEVVWAVIGINTLLACAYLATAAAYNSDRQQSDLTRIISDLRSALTNHYPHWVYTSVDLLALEKETPFKAIWIVSPDLSNDTFIPQNGYNELQNELQEVIKKNVSRGIIYTYFIPKAPSLNPAIQSLNKLFSSRPKQLQIIALPPEIWYSTFMSHIFILNPLAEKDLQPDVYLELPLEGQVD